MLVIMENITAEKNIQNLEFGHSYRICLYICCTKYWCSLFLNGSSSFTDNYESVFGVMNTKIVLEGILHLKNNSAYIGSVFNVIGSSWFILNDGLNANLLETQQWLREEQYMHTVNRHRSVRLHLMVQILVC